MSFSAAPSVKQGWPSKPLWGIPFPPSQGHCLACSCWACCSCPHSGAPAVHLHCPAQPCLVWAPPHRVAQMQNLRLGGTCSLLAGGCWLMESFLLTFLSNLGDSPLGLAWAGVARSGGRSGGASRGCLYSDLLDASGGACRQPPVLRVQAGSSLQVSQPHPVSSQGISPPWETFT